MGAVTVESKKTPETRIAYVERYENTGLNSQYGLSVEAVGDYNQIMIVYGPPSSEAALREIISLQFDKHYRAELCLNGFDEVQAISKDESGTQSLIGKWDLYPKDWFSYLRAHMVVPIRSKDGLRGTSTKP